MCVVGKIGALKKVGAVQLLPLEFKGWDSLEEYLTKKVGNQRYNLVSR